MNLKTERAREPQSQDGAWEDKVCRQVFGTEEAAEIQPLYTGTELNLRDRVLGKVEKNSFIALSGKGDHSGLMPSKLCVPTPGVWGLRSVIVNGQCC